MEKGGRGEGGGRREKTFSSGREVEVEREGWKEESKLKMTPKRFTYLMIFFSMEQKHIFEQTLHATLGELCRWEQRRAQSTALVTYIALSPPTPRSL